MSDAKLKKEPKKAWYRVGLIIIDFKYYSIAADNEADEVHWLNQYNFVRWLTDRIEYELPEDKP